ncbi:MAG: hypothetical protein K9M98_08470 [Cephaloticoccus sp.]|nr:hypothetical protein [Cephaloticoccus sp.]MCF7760524.1 hypothetical protein [Cephaloticoccus sp.]
MKHSVGMTFWTLALSLLMGGCFNPPAEPRPLVIARFLIEASATQAAIPVTLPVSGVKVRVIPKPVLTEFDILSVAEAQVDMGRCMLFRVTAPAARDLYRLTASQVGRRLVLVLNGQPVGARVIDRPVEGGMLFIFLELPAVALPQLADDLNYTAGKIQQEAAHKG